MKYTFCMILKLALFLKEKSSDHFKDLHQMALLKKFDVSPTPFLGGVMN